MSIIDKVVKQFRKLIETPLGAPSSIEKTDAERYADAIKKYFQEIDEHNSKFLERDYAYAVLRVFKARGVPDVLLIDEIAEVLDQSNILACGWAAKFFLYVAFLTQLSIDRETPELFASQCEAIFIEIPCCPITGTLCAMPIDGYSAEKLAAIAKIAEYFRPLQKEGCSHRDRLAGFIRSLQARLTVQSQLKSLRTLNANSGASPDRIAELIPTGLDFSRVTIRHDERVCFLAHSLLTQIHHFVSSGEQHPQTIILPELSKVVLYPSLRGSTEAMIESVVDQLMATKDSEARTAAASMLRSIF